MKYRATLALLLTVATTGCYSYLPATRQTLSPRTEVRVRPTLEYRAGLRDLLGTEPSVLDGSVVDLDDTALTLEVVTAGIQFGTRAQPLTQRLVVPWSQLLEVQERRVDRARTTGVIAAAGVAAVAALVFVFRGEFGGTVDGPPDGGDEARIPIPLPFP